jgi:hypothetical protein
MEMEMSAEDPKQKAESEKVEQNAEQTKLAHDYLKHLATLTTGSILLLVTFLEKFLTNLRGKWAITVSLCLFTISIVCNIAAQTGNMETMYYTPKQMKTSVWNRITVGGMIATWVTFLVGLIVLVIFALRNIF